MKTAEDKLILEAVKKLQYMGKLLDCTNPPKKLAEQIGFNTVTFSSVSVAIDPDLCFAFELSVPYEQSSFEYIAFDEIDEYVDFPWNIKDKK